MLLSAVTTTSSAPGAPWFRSGSAEEGLFQQVHVQADDHGCDDARGDGRRTTVDEPAHEVAVTREEHERDERERNPEGQEHLAEDERARRTGPDREQGQ